MTDLPMNGPYDTMTTDVFPRPVFVSPAWRPLPTAAELAATLLSLEPIRGEPPPKPRPAVYVPLARRNEPCPCGSGKKYKRCCRNPR